MSDENKLFTIKLTEDEVDQCVHAINKLCEAFIKDGCSIDDAGIQSYLDTARKLNSVFTRPTTNTDRFAMGTPSVDYAGENKEGDCEPSHWRCKQSF